MESEQDTNRSNSRHDLLRMGWSPHFQTQLEQFSGDGLIPARVVGVGKNGFRTNNGKRKRLATLAGRLKHDTLGTYPVTGDWVLMSDSVIHRVLDRKNALSRGASGTHEKQDPHPQKGQIIAANLDTVFIVSGLDRDFNPRRIERYLTLVYNCGLDPVIILTKADLHRNPGSFIGELETSAFGVPVYPVSATDETALKPLEPYMGFGRTTAMVGSSGAGKSTLVNRLHGKTVQLTGSLSDHVGKGKHTTTSRDLIMMPQGGMVIDNPGMREIALWEVDQGIETAFPDIEKLALECRFADCTHTHEPGCRVLGAVDEGAVSEHRLGNYRKMKRETAYLSQRRHKSADRVEKDRWKKVALEIKAIKRRNNP